MRPLPDSLQTKAYTGTAAAIDNGVGEGVNAIAVSCSSAAHIRITKSGTAATTSDFPVAAGQMYYFSCPPNAKVSAIQQSTGGTLSVIAMTQ
jgi:hypothetical protein